MLLEGGAYWVETVHVAHDKAAGVRRLCVALGLAPDARDAVAFGDGANDATMLAAVGLGIAMAQGRPEAKAAADRTSRWTNDEDAVAREIWALLEK
jgi:hydroxymethylpyrimidine pyrophosphatase-like HAD family hydrolase